MTQTSDQWLSNVKMLCLVPGTQNVYSNTKFYTFGNRLMKSVMLPMIASVAQNYFLTKTETDLVVDQTVYRIPTRAAWRKLREFKLVGPNDEVYNFPLIDISNTQFYRFSPLPMGFYFYGDRIEVVPPPTSDDYALQFWWYLPPNDLVPVSNAAIVSSVSGDDVTVSSVPSLLTSGVTVDFIQGTSGSSCLGIDAEITGIAGNVISFGTSVVPNDLAEGDYISLTGTSPVVQIPDEAVPLFETLTAIDILNARGDRETAQNLHEIRDMQKEYLLKSLEPRVDGEPTVILNQYGLVRSARRGMFPRGWLFE